ncbi:MAG: AraC family transcriptional regulator [Microbacterium sp.]|nr:MAG: AraC family transcriptional regulator [Microbacterium sp.]
MTATTPWTPVDPLTEALFRLRMDGVFYAWTTTSGPCALDMPRVADCLSFHVVAEGEVWIDVDGADPVLLRPGDVALVPRGLGHRLATDLAAPSSGRADEVPQQMVGDHYAVLHLGPTDVPPSASMLCGVVSIESAGALPVLQLLPPVIVLTAGEQDRLQRLVALMLEEVLDPRPGGEAVTTRLADVLVVEAVRSWLQRDPAARTGWLAALRDPVVGVALAAVHRDPGHAWSLAALARAASMSRSSFAARFTALAGVPAMEYVTTWRMLVARERLRGGDDTVAAVALDLGYGSEAAFSRAYKRVLGAPPRTDARRPVLAEPT